MTLWKSHSLSRKLPCGLSPGHGDRLSLAEYVFRPVCRHATETLAVARGYNLLYILSILYGTYYGARTIGVCDVLLSVAAFLGW